MLPRHHRARKAALEHAIDLAQFAARGGFAIDRAESRQYVLAQIPKGLEVASEAHTLGHPVNGMAAVGVQQRQHCAANLAHPTVRRTAQTEDWEGQQVNEIL